MLDTSKQTKSKCRNPNRPCSLCVKWKRIGLDCSQELDNFPTDVRCFEKSVDPAKNKKTELLYLLRKNGGKNETDV